MDGKMNQYREVAEDIRRKIIDGELKPSEKLKTERALSEEYGVSRVTVRRALKVLEEERLVRRVQGSGTYVNPASLRRIPVMIDYTGSMKNHAPSLERKVMKAVQSYPDTEIAALLNISEEDIILATERIDYSSGEAIAFDKGYLPIQYAQKLTDRELQEVSFLEVWSKISGFDITSCNQNIEAILATEECVEYLKVEPGSPILKSTETYYAKEDAIAGVFISYYHPQHICINSRFNWQSINQTRDYQYDS